MLLYFLALLKVINLKIKNTSHYLLHCHQFLDRRVDLMNSVKCICDNFDTISDNVKEDLLLYGDW